MLRRQVFIMLAAVLLAGGLFYGINRLFTLRLEHGDVYPPYSTLRADPLGAKALYEAFESQPGVEVSRNYRPLPKLKTENPVTLVYAGVPVGSQWGSDELMVFETLLTQGSRAVFSFLPEREREKSATFAKDPETKKPTDEANPQKQEKPEAGKKGDSKETTKSMKRRLGGQKPKSEKTGKTEKKEGQPDSKSKDGKTDDDDDSDEEDSSGISFAGVSKDWGFRFEVIRAKDKETGEEVDGTAKATPAAAGLEPELPWHSALYFTDLKPVWRVLYTYRDHPVVIERPWGKGSIIFVGDSFLLSNEALRSDRAPHLLASLVGPSNVIFDEEHHGVTESENIAGLVRRYQLQGAAFVLLIIAGLFVWQNVVSFVPAYGSAVVDDVVAGQESAEGFVNLLRRSIARSDILNMCVAEWRKAFGHKATDVAKLDSALANSSNADPVTAYSNIAASLRSPASSKTPTSTHS